MEGPMGRFSRRRKSGREWVAQLPERFSLEDVSRKLTGEELRDALSWLYDAIQRGRVEPQQTADGMRYAFTGRRRERDGIQPKSEHERADAVA
jgi:hypothetical protein